MWAEWPIREALMSFEEVVCQRAMTAFMHEQLVWAILAPHRKRKKAVPKMPKVLRDRDGDA